MRTWKNRQRKAPQKKKTISRKSQKYGGGLGDQDTYKILKQQYDAATNELAKGSIRAQLSNVYLDAEDKAALSEEGVLLPDTEFNRVAGEENLYETGPLLPPKTPFSSVEPTFPQNIPSSSESVASNPQNETYLPPVPLITSQPVPNLPVIAQQDPLFKNKVLEGRYPVESDGESLPSVQQCAAETQELKARLAALESLNNEAETNARDMETRAAGILRDKIEQSEKLKGLQIQFSNLKSDFFEVQDDKESLKTYANKLLSQITALKNGLGGASTTISELEVFKNKVPELQAKLSALTGSSEEMKSTLEQVTKELEIHKELFQVLFDTTQTEIVELQAKHAEALAGLKSQLDKTLKDLDNSKKHISGLSAKFEKAKAQTAEDLVKKKELTDDLIAMDKALSSKENQLSKVIAELQQASADLAKVRQEAEAAAAKAFLELQALNSQVETLLQKNKELETTVEEKHEALKQLRVILNLAIQVKRKNERAYLAAEAELEKLENDAKLAAASAASAASALETEKASKEAFKNQALQTAVVARNRVQELRQQLDKSTSEAKQTEETINARIAELEAQVTSLEEGEKPYINLVYGKDSSDVIGGSNGRSATILEDLHIQWKKGKRNDKWLFVVFGPNEEVLDTKFVENTEDILYKTIHSGRVHYAIFDVIYK